MIERFSFPREMICFRILEDGKTGHGDVWKVGWTKKTLEIEVYQSKEMLLIDE